MSGTNGGVDRERRRTSNEGTVKFSVSLSEDVYKAALEQSKTEHRTLSNLIAHAVATYLESVEQVAS